MSEGFILTPIETVTARLVTYEWAWARDNAETIAENWRRRCAARSGLFDGRVLLASGYRIEATTCSVEMFETSYASFITHKDLGSPDAAVANAFAAIVPRGVDGAVLLGVMGGHTANAGQIYFPCGTPDLGDVREGGEIDLAGSAAREFTEETGLTLPPDASERWLLARGEGQLAFLNAVTFPEPGAVLQNRMEKHRFAEAEPELDGFVVVRAPGDVDTRRMPAFVRAYLRHALMRSATLPSWSRSD
ncbi:hypothetical protein [Methylobacterium sp. 77]|uniref:hypothetical protein n=1 Tax=Methylobacterium sp. 77 TaxID=1101192 RepID=UPI0003750F23|nr:hypothetical protein [Methylobacterium sp. 77]